jgi:hypothetical protein
LKIVTELSSHPLHSTTINSKLHELAPMLLCKRVHQNQSEVTANDWAAKISCEIQARAQASSIPTASRYIQVLPSSNFPPRQNPTDNCLICQDAFDMNSENLSYYACTACSCSFHGTCLETWAQEYAGGRPICCPHW